MQHNLLILNDREKEKINQIGILSLEELNVILQREEAGFRRKKKTERWDILYQPQYIFYKKELLSFFKDLGFIMPIPLEEIVNTDLATILRTPRR